MSRVTHLTKVPNTVGGNKYYAYYTKNILLKL